MINRRISKSTSYRDLSRRSLAIGVFFVLLLVSNIFVTIVMANSGWRLKEIESYQKNLVERNREIMEEMVKKTSLTLLEKESVGLGFVESNTVLYLKKAKAVASSGY